MIFSEWQYKEIVKSVDVNPFLGGLLPGLDLLWCEPNLYLTLCILYGVRAVTHIALRA